METLSHLETLAEALKDIAPEKFPHGLEQYARFGPKTVRAILAVRDLVMHSPDLEDTKFRIGLTTLPGCQEAEDREAGCVKFQVIFESSDQGEARTVEADVRLNFLWHFPGRCLNKGDYRQAGFRAGSPLSVYIACFPATTCSVLGKV